MGKNAVIFPPVLGIRPRVLAGHFCDSPTSGITACPKGDGPLWSMIDVTSDINCLTLFILLTKEIKMMNSALHEVQKNSKNLRKSTLKVSSPPQVQWTDNKNLAVYWAWNLHFSTRQDLCNTRSYCSDIAEEVKRIATNCQVNHTNKKMICPQEQLFYLVLSLYISQHSRKHTLWMAPEANKPQQRF